VTYRSYTLDKRITFQSPNLTPDECGQLNGAWVNGSSMFASIIDISGREYVTSAENNEVTTKIVIRYRPGITPAMRILHGATVYHVEAVLNQFDRFLMLMCKRMA
jgi:SPP1 family predicted phage head-tail adaptor